MSVEFHPKSAQEPHLPPAPGSAGQGTELRGLLDETRTRLIAEIAMMTQHLATAGKAPDPATVALLGKADAGETPTIEELITSHGALCAAIAPATPRTISTFAAASRTHGIARIFGPTPDVRRIMAANIFFVLAFFGLSLTSQINHDTIVSSIYDLQGIQLLIKLLFILSAAGMGATFGALFEIWEDIRAGSYDPATESAHWMRIALGIVAGLVLSEIVGSSTAAAASGSDSITEPLLALVGGFSARILHLVIARIVAAIEHTFEPIAKRSAPPAAPAQAAAPKNPDPSSKIEP